MSEVEKVYSSVFERNYSGEKSETIFQARPYWFGARQR
jgi:hypothetical protein